MPQKPVVDDFIPDDFEADPEPAPVATEPKRPVGATGSWQPSTLERAKDILRFGPGGPTIPQIGQRAAGVGESVVDTGRAAMQWGQNVAGLPVSPTPLPSADPDRQFGRMMGSMAQYGALTAATGGTSLPAQVAAGGVGSSLIAAGQEQDPTVAAGIGMTAPIAGRIVSTVRNIFRAKDNPARALNATMEVNPADISDRVNPGKQLLAEKDLNLNRMGLSKEHLFQLLKTRRTEVGNEIGQKLGQASPARTLDISDLPGIDTPAAKAVLAEMKLSAQPGQPIIISPQEAHAFRSMLGDKINWSADARAANDATGMNEALKGLYRETNNLIERAVPGIRALNTRWANYHVGEKSTEWALQKQAVSQPGIPGSTLMSAIHRTTAASPLTTTYAPMSRALQMPQLPQGSVSVPLRAVQERDRLERVKALR